MEDSKVHSKGREEGVSFLEISCAVAILAMTAVVGMGALGRIAEQAASDSVVTKVRALVNAAATQAVIRRSYVGVVFSDSTRGASGCLVEDGDGDGITHEDIRRGIDRPLGSPVVFREGKAYLGVPPSVNRDPAGRPLSPADPVKFGRGDILSFSPTATATPGSLYIRDASGTVAWAFRVTGLGGRVRVFRWFRGKWDAWG